MGWIDINDKKPPEGLQVLLEVSGYYSAAYGLVADHSFIIGSRLIPQGKTEETWILWDNSNGDAGPDDGHICDPTIHAWMPLPKHFGANEMGFEQEPDLMEHAMFENDPEWLYKGDCVYEQMSIEELLGGTTHDN